jgi:hypothetical protein
MSDHSGRSASVPVGSPQRLEDQENADALPASHSAEASNQPPELHGPAMSRAPATYPQLRAAMSAVIAQRDELLRIAKGATNGWACYAKRKIEHDEIARLHDAITAVAMRVQASPASRYQRGDDDDTQTPW